MIVTEAREEEEEEEAGLFPAFNSICLNTRKTNCTKRWIKYTPCRHHQYYIMSQIILHAAPNFFSNSFYVRKEKTLKILKMVKTINYMFKMRIKRLLKP